VKILLVNTYESSWGAGIACKRLFRALESAGVDVQLLVRDKISSDDRVITTNKPFFRHIGRIFRIIIERGFFMVKEKSKAVRYLFSIANMGENVTRLNAFKNADIIHLHWINNAFVSIKNLERIFTSGKIIIWTLHDQWPFTGGCHLVGECERFKSYCHCCPYLRKPKNEDVSTRIWNKKLVLC